MDRPEFVRAAMISVLPAAATECRGKSKEEIAARALEIAEAAADAAPDGAGDAQTRLKKQPMNTRKRK